MIIAVLCVALLVVAALAWRERRAAAAASAALAASRVREAPAEALDPVFLALAAAVDDGMLVVEADRRISFANRAAGALLGTQRGELRGKTAIAAVRDYRVEQAIDRALATGEALDVTLSAARGRRNLRVLCQPIDGDHRRAVVVLRDVTRLAQLQRARREMVANVSHELATPLAATRLLVETLLSDPPPEVRRHMLGQIDDELTAMTQLVDELRELSQIESGRLMLKLHPVNLAPLVERAIARVLPQAERCGLTVRNEVDARLPPALIDDVRIGQVLLNLLHNALKWTPEGGTISVRAAPTAESAAGSQRDGGDTEPREWLKLSVADTGIGIPVDEQERVFERFYKVDRARTRDHSGTGLGLAIAKHLVERHGGRIWVESEEGHGSTFYLILPAAGPEDAPEPGADAMTADQR